MKRRKAGGRKPGTSNRRTVEREGAAKKAAARIGAAIKGAFVGDAHEQLMALYKDREQPLQIRIDAAKAALPYEKGRRVPTEPKEPDRGSLKFTLVLDHPDDDIPEGIAARMAARRSANGDPQ